jgi:hypothetical protein
VFDAIPSQFEGKLVSAGLEFSPAVSKVELKKADIHTEWYPAPATNAYVKLIYGIEEGIFYKEFSATASAGLVGVEHKYHPETFSLDLQQNFAVSISGGYGVLPNPAVLIKSNLGVEFAKHTLEVDQLSVDHSGFSVTGAVAVVVGIKESISIELLTGVKAQLTSDADAFTHDAVETNASVSGISTLAKIGVATQI